jgi:DNA repair protein RecO (recombination protein O)
MPSRERSIRVETVVLRHSDWGEADRLLWLFTRELGKVRAVGKGLRKPRSRKAGHLEPFTRVNLLMAQGRDLWIITQAETVEAYLRLREDLLRVGYASYVVEILDRFTYEEGENQPLYRLLIETLARIDSEENPLFAVRYYEVHLLDILGYRPQLVNCAGCGKVIQAEDQYFSAAQGGALCPACGSTTQGANPISMQSLKYLRHIQRSKYLQASRAQISPSVHRELEIILQHYVTYLLERGLNTPAFLRRVRNLKKEGEIDRGVE